MFLPPIIDMSVFLPAAAFSFLYSGWAPSPFTSILEKRLIFYGKSSASVTDVQG